MDRTVVQHKSLADGRWEEIPFHLQMANIGSEVSRAIRWKKKNREKRCLAALFRGLELIDFSIEAASRMEPGSMKAGHLKELCRCREELCDYFIGENEFHTDPDRLQKYYDQFAMMQVKK